MDMTCKSLFSSDMSPSSYDCKLDSSTFSCKLPYFKYCSFDIRQSLFPTYQTVNGGGNNLYPRCCEICNKVYAKKQSFRKHKSKCGKICEKKYPKPCDVCSHTYQSKRSFYNHKAYCQKLMGKKSTKITYSRTCPTCSLTFSNKTSFSKHLLVCSSDVHFIHCSFTCCRLKFSSNKQMLHHLKFDHLNNATRILYFKSNADFKDWKKSEEQKNFSTMRKVRSKVSEGRSINYFHCMFREESRSINIRKTVRKRRYGQIPRSSCPAGMIVKKFDTGLISVKYVYHHSHSLGPENLIYQRWLPETRVAVKRLLKDGVSVNEIRKKFILPNNSKHPYLIREQFMTTRQISQYKYRMIAEQQKCQDDATSIKMRVDSMTIEEKHNILVYKPQGCDTHIGDSAFDSLPYASELFVYGFTSEFQLRELEEGAKRGICIDATFKTNRYNFYLLNLLVPDEYNNGFVVAQFITNHLDTHIMTLFFKSIKNRCPNLMANVVMTDDDPAIFKAFCRVFNYDNPDNKPKHLLCKWHVTCAWRVQCIKKIKDARIRTEVFNDLMVIMNEKNTNDFHQALKKFFEKYSSPVFARFIHYFKTYYHWRPEKWAMCYRNFYHASIDTNMYVESYHSTLKRRLGRKSNYRLDRMIEMLEEMVQEKWLKLSERRMKGEPPADFHDPTDLRHRRGISIPSTSVLKISDNVWDIKSECKKNVIYTVTLQFPQCNLPDHCFMKCSNMSCLGLCSHLFKCSCSDEALLCKHIHCVYSLETRDHPRSLPIARTHKVNNKQILETSYKKTLTDTSEPEINNPSAQRDVAFQSLVQQLHSLFRLQDSSGQTMILDALKSQINKISSEQCDIGKDLNGASQVPSMQCSFAPNQKSPLQPKMFKTIKKRTTPRFKSFKKPERNELHILKEKLLNFEKGMVDNENVLCEQFSTPTSSAFMSTTNEIFNDTAYASTSQVSSAQCTDNTSAQFVSSHKSLGSKSFTEPIDDFEAADKCLYNIDDFYMTHLELKSLDMFISDEEEKQLNKVCQGFVRGWLFDSVIEMFIHILLNGIEDTYLIRSFYVQIAAKTKDVSECVARFPSISYETLRTILIPCCLNEVHWVLIVVKVQEKQILFFDPYTNSIEASHLELLSKWMKILSNLLHENVFQWNSPYSPAHVLQPHTDAVNCGPFICYYVYKILKNEILHTTFETNMFRKFIFDTIVNQASSH